jgi:hypothetical protein
MLQEATLHESPDAIPSPNNPWFHPDDAVLGNVSRVQPAGYLYRNDSPRSGSPAMPADFHRLPEVSD